jgi:quinol monooxygenase YgiN
MLTEPSSALGGVMIVVEAVINLVDPRRREACLDASAPVQRATREDEPGCLVYCFAADPVVDGRIQVYELWEDAASLAAHFEHANYREMRTLLAGFGLASAVSRKHLVARSAPVYDDDRRPTAGFADGAPAATDVQGAQVTGSMTSR